MESRDTLVDGVPNGYTRGDLLASCSFDTINVEDLRFQTYMVQPNCPCSATNTCSCNVGNIVSKSIY